MLLNKLKSIINLLYFIYINLKTVLKIRTIEPQTDDALIFSGLNANDSKEAFRLYTELNSVKKINFQNKLLWHYLGNKFCFIAKTNAGRIVGLSFYYVNFKDISENTIHEAFTKVDTEFRGKGIATKLRSIALKHFEKSGFCGVSSRVSLSNKDSLSINLKLGFKPVEQYIDGNTKEERYYLIKKFSHSMSNKEKYKVLCEQEESIPIFSQAWWLDAVAENEWDVVLVERNDQIVASLPFVLKQKFGFKVITMPKLTQHLGPWLRPSVLNTVNHLSVEKELIQSLFSKLPKHHLFRQNWFFVRKNWLPLYWMGYQQTTKYTYRIEDLTDLDSIWGNFNNSVRKNIKKAQDKFKLQIRYDLNINDFLELNKKVFERQNIKLPYSTDLVRRIDVAAEKRKCKQILIAVNDEGKMCGGTFLIWDKQSAYLLLGGSDPDLRDSAAIPLVRWEAIKYAANVTKSFDCEGSMIEGVERSYRAFGTTQTPYFSIFKTNSKILKAYQFLQDLRR